MIRRLLVCLLVACAAWQINAADCRKIGEQCTDGPSTKNIQGVDIYRDCWSYTDTYECVDPDASNYCAGLQTNGGCTETSSTCSANAFNGTCTTLTKTFRCGDAVAAANGVIALNSTYTVAQDTQDYSACASLSNNPSCQKIGQVCTSGPATRNINGLDVYRDCWDWRDDYSCIAADYVNYCQPLVSMGCQPQGPGICVDTAFDGSCNRYEKTFSCTNKPPVSGQTIVSLNTSYTIVSDNLNASACDPYSSNADCVLAGQRCVEGPETRVVNGLSLYRDCWKYEQDYTCQVANAINFCLPLENIPSCQEAAPPTCYETSANNTCNAQLRTYRCDNEVGPPLPTNVLFLNMAYTIVSENVNNQCVNLENNPNCTVASSTCTDGPGTKNINGLDVYRDCWVTEKVYVCSDPNLSESDCAQLDQSPKCSLTSDICTDINNITNQCALRTRTYSCEDKPTTTTTETVCGTEMCIAGVCAPTDGPPDNGFADAVVGLEVGRQAGVYGDYANGTFFNGSRSDCSKKLFGSVSCCSPKVDAGSSNSGYSTSMEFGMQAGRETVQFLGSTYMHDALFTSGAPDAIINALYGSTGGASFAANFSFYGITWDSVIGFGFDPTSFAIAVAIYIITQYLQCDQQEQVLALRKGQNLCHYVGTYCSKKVLGGCGEKAESYCCFNSRLARIIHEGGRPQIGKTWGAPDSPQCGGFTQAQLEGIDFSQIDFSEFVREIAAKVVNTSAATARATDRATDIKNTGTSYFPPPGAVGVICSHPPC